MSRRISRELALKCLFSSDFQPESTFDSIFETAKETGSSIQGDDLDYAKKLFNGTLSLKKDIDVILGQVSKGWSVARMPIIDRNLLRLAVFEIFYAEPVVPAAVAINEAIELAKLYSGDKSSVFINGVLGKIVKNHEA